MNKFLKEMAVLYDKLNKAEGFNCVLVIQDIEQLYEKHKKELLEANGGAEVSSENDYIHVLAKEGDYIAGEITDWPKSPQYIMKCNQPEKESAYKEYLVGPTKISIPLCDVEQFERMTQKDREQFAISILNAGLNSSGCKYHQ